MRSKPSGVEVAVFLLGCLFAALAWAHIIVERERCEKIGGVLVVGVLDMRCVEPRPAPSSRP